MAKSIRSKAKRKLRAAKREKIAAKERVKLLAIQEEERGVKMVQDPVENIEIGDNIPAFSGEYSEIRNILIQVLCIYSQGIYETKRISPCWVKLELQRRKILC